MQKDWTLTIPIHIRWHDIDANGHVNNLVYFEWAHIVRAELVMMISEADKHFDRKRRYWVLGECNMKYTIPIKYPGSIRAQARINNVGNTSITLDFRVMNDRDKECATGIFRMILFDFIDNIKCTIPESTRQSIALIESHSHEYPESQLMKIPKTKL